MPIQGPQWTEFLACPVCYNGFNNQGREPVSLACGHSICKSCLSRLSKQSCPFDQTEVTKNIDDLPYNYALLQLVGQEPPDTLKVNIKEVEENQACFEESRKCIECLGQYLAPLANNNGAGSGTTNLGGANVHISSTNSGSGVLTRPMQRKLVTLVNCQLAEEEGRCRALRAARSLGERAVKELILLHQNPQQLSANLWSAVRARGCQFLGPAMQEEVLRLILLALEEGDSLCRKVLVLYVVQRLENHFSQASKTSIGHVVQLLYRASCFKVTKREGDSSLLQLQERYRTYSALRKEHDAQIVQIAMEAGLHISPEQWSALLYGDDAHKSHMQSIIDKLQTPASFGSSIQELIIALQRTGDPANLQRLRSYLELLANIDPNPEGAAPSWNTLSEVMDALKVVVNGLVDFMQNHSAKVKGSMEPQQPVNSKYKTHMCRDIVKKGACPRGNSCSFAHSSEELERYGRRRKNVTPRVGGSYTPVRNGSSSSPETVDAGDKPTSNGLDTSASDKECQDTLPDDAASIFRRVPRDAQESLLLHEVQTGIRNLCNPTQYPGTVNGQYPPSFTLAPGVADRSSAATSPLGFVGNTVHGGMPNGYYPPSQPPPPVSGLPGSFGAPEQIPSSGIPPVTRDMYLNGQSDVPHYFDVTRTRTESYPPQVMPSSFYPPYGYVNDNRYPRTMECAVSPFHNRITYNQNPVVYSSQGPEGFGNFPMPYYGPDPSRTKGGRMPESAGVSLSSVPTGVRAKGYRDDFADDIKKSKNPWPSEPSVDVQGKPEYFSSQKFSKISLGSCGDPSSSYDYSSDTFSPLSSGSSHPGSPTSTQLTEYDSKIWEPLSHPGDRNIWDSLRSKSQSTRWPPSDNWSSRQSEIRKYYGSIRDVWQTGSSRLHQSCDDDSLYALNRSLPDDPSNTSCDSNTPSLPETSVLEKDEGNRSYESSPFSMSFMKQQSVKANDPGSCYRWGMVDKDLSNQCIDDDRSFITRASAMQRTVAPPPGLTQNSTTGIKPIGYLSDRYRGPMTCSETTQAGSDQSRSESLSDIGGRLNGGRHQQVGVNYGKLDDVTVHE